MFDAAEAKITELDGRILALETATPVDHSTLEEQVEAAKVAIVALNESLSALEARLDAIAIAAAG